MKIPKKNKDHLLEIVAVNIQNHQSVIKQRELELDKLKKELSAFKEDQKVLLNLEEVE